MFEGCFNLSAIEMLGEVTEIDMLAFRNCYKLQESVKLIKDQAFLLVENYNK